MALQYSTISVEPAPGYGVHNPGPASTGGFEAMPGAKVFAPEKQMDYHLDVAAQSPAIVSVSAVTHRTDFFPKGSVVTVVQISNSGTLTDYAQSKVMSSGSRISSEIAHMVAISKPDETCKGCKPYENVFDAAKKAFTEGGGAIAVDMKPLGVLAEAVSIKEFTPTVIPVAVMGAIEATCDQNVEKWFDMFPGERVLLRVSGVSRSCNDDKKLVTDLLGTHQDHKKNEAANDLFDNIVSPRGFRHPGFYAQGVLARVITPPERSTGLVYVYLE